MTNKISWQITNVKYMSVFNWLVLVCCYIEISAVFKQIRIPFFLLPERYMDDFNNLMENLAVGILTGFIVYTVTVILQKYIGRQMHKWEIYDWALDLNDKVVNLIETEMGCDCMKIDEEMYMSHFDRKFYDNIYSQLTTLLSEGKPIEQYLNAEENKALCDIYKYRKIEVYYKEMNDKQITEEKDKLRYLCISIKIINSNIQNFIRKNNKKNNEYGDDCFAFHQQNMKR